MSFTDRPFSSEPEPDNEERLAAQPHHEQELASMDSAELARLEEGASRLIALPVNGRASAALDALIPLAANAAQAAQTHGMAVIKFPEGVTWADLCVRQADGWNLLSSFKDGKFNKMAGIKQAGMQPAAVANLALQGAAVAVGMAYMNEISGQLEGIQSSVNALQRDMERERDANLKAAYDSLVRLAIKYDEHGASADKRTVAHQTIETALQEADKAWNYQLECIADFAAGLTSKKKMAAGEISEASRKLTEMENRALAAFQLTLAALQIDMRLDNDYTSQRMANDRKITSRKVEEFSRTRGDARLILSGKISKVGGKPLALADCVEDDYQAANAVLGILHEGKKNAGRLHPVRMHNKAKGDIAARRAKLQEEVSTENIVSAVASSNEEELEALSFAFNEADTIVFDGESLRLFKTGESDVIQQENPA